MTFATAARPADGGNGPGAAGAEQIRLADHGYADGGATIAGADRPNPRQISNTVFSQVDAGGATIDKPNAGGFSSLLWVWGQFLDHDLSQTRNGAAFGTAPIAVPAGDPVFAPGSTLSFSRSAFEAGTGTSPGNPRTYVNEITSFIDASQVYGSSDDKLEALLQPGTAKLKLTASGTIDFGVSTTPVFGAGAIAGDTRAAENVALLSMQALFAREHNRLVDALKAADPTLTVDEQFEGARARVEAIVQAISYNEFLPILIGEGAIDDYDGFKSSVDPSIALEFSTAIYRFGHTLLSPTLARMNENGTTHAAGNLALRDAFNTRGVVEQTGIEAIFRGMSTTRSQEFDTFVVEDVRSLLFGGGGPGSDLAALNIQRGRDHGLPTYNEMRADLGLAARTSFAQITDDAAVVARLTAAYGGDISKLDLWVGGLAEDSVGGGIMGETFRAVMIDQFGRLRDGDAFWSEGRGFGAAELDTLWSTTLSDVIRRNSGVANLQDDVFLAYARRGGGSAADTITGGSGRNLIIGENGADTLTGGALSDAIFGGNDNDRITGLGGDDTLTGGPGADTIFGGAGNDRITGGSGQDTLNGEDGQDVFLTRGGAASLSFINGGGGTDTIRLDDLAADVTLTGTSRITGVERYEGGGKAILGTSAANVLDLSIFSSVTGVASVQGLAGNDTLTGGAGVDRLLGGDGADLLLIRGTQGQTDAIDGGAGADTLRVIAAGGDATLAGTQRIVGVEIFDGAGRNLIGTSAADVFDFSGFASVTGIASVQAGNGNDAMTGSAGADRLVGGAGNDAINGRLGDDALTGGSGVDTIFGSEGDDVILIRSNAAATDAISGGEGFDRIMLDDFAADIVLNGTQRITGVEAFNGGGRAVRGSAGADALDFSIFQAIGDIASIQGLDGDDAIIGNAGADVLLGGAGADRLTGALGSDTLTGGAGSDVFRFVAASHGGDDEIADFDASGDDALRFNGFSFGSGNPGGLSTAQKLAAVSAATDFDAGGATIDLADIGGEGSVRLDGVSSLSFSSEDFVFG